ncbi:SMI1/KNR4 family protein [Bartonella sp. HY406]|uniref:SMI1/KNR4 family protein n=1 Tax=Bartonella sp. HY406 TaxID=2979331 RepID=UPI0021C68064|nr:SMI1/KNR4 family protein [Bartonella sp. HY406]UXN05072.1 SMI1/KNR4 family protein [Bartonella sp. HY406]
MADMEIVKAKFEEVNSRKLVPDIVGTPRTLNPVLSEKDIIFFQKKFSVELPEDYIFYLTNIANGGLGPSMEMIALDLNGVKDPRIIDDGESSEIDLAANFPFESAWNDNSVLKYDDRLPNDVFDNYWAIKKISGSIPIGIFGCGEIALLIVNGMRRGDIWRDDRMRRSGIYPLNEGANTSFADWLDMWLDDVLNGVGQYDRRGD